MTKQIATVTFHGTPLTVITQDDQQLVAMRPIIEAIGLGWQSQYNRIQRHPVLKSTVVMMNTVAQDGKQRQLLCLPLDYLNGWLFGVDVNRVREDIRDTLIQYQRECYQVLADYWQKGEAKAPARKRQPKALPNGLTLEQQDAIKAMVKARVEALPQEKRAKGAITCWSALKSKFGCTYKDISPDQFTDAASLVARVVLDGEYLGKEQTPAPALNIHYPLSFITDQHPKALKAYTASHDQLDLSLYQLDERHNSAVESILHTLAQAGYQVDAAWFEIRTYRNKARDLERTLAALNNVFQSPMTYLVNKAAR